MTVIERIRDLSETQYTKWDHLTNNQVQMKVDDAMEIEWGAKGILVSAIKNEARHEEPSP